MEVARCPVEKETANVRIFSIEFGAWLLLLIGTNDRTPEHRAGNARQRPCTIRIATKAVG